VTARDPLAGRAADLAGVSAITGGAVGLETVPFQAQVGLRLDPREAGRAPYPLPLDPDTAREEGSRAALWLGPDEWLVLGPPGAGPAIVEELDAALDGLHRSVLDLSANRVALELTGPGRFELLCALCSLDLHPRSWHSGRCAQTLLARVPVVLHERGDSTGILVRPSVVDHVIDVLLDAVDGLDAAFTPEGPPR
jgi:sarcosine oxidase, subunit gamma